MRLVLLCALVLFSVIKISAFDDTFREVFETLQSLNKEAFSEDSQGIAKIICKVACNVESYRTMLSSLTENLYDFSLDKDQCGEVCQGIFYTQFFD